MSFASLTFAAFLAAGVLAFRALPGAGARRWLLLGASLWFYAAWNPPFLLLLLAATLADWALARGMERWPARRNLFLGASLAGNLGLLAAYKYADFLLANLGRACAWLGADNPLPGSLDLLLPLGISFYTFQKISYVVDVWRGTCPAARSPSLFVLYIAFFPQLVAGPICRAHELLGQLENPRAPGLADSLRGLNRIALGLAKKAILADWLATVVEPVFAAPGAWSPAANFVALHLYAFQIFLDFSGYCDIGIGAGMLFGVRLPENFLRPYLAASVTEFWRRWHVTLSSWLRDYLYIPLGGNRRGGRRRLFNLLATMLLGGLWHGAAWTFIVWGGLHGLYLAVHKGLERRRGTRPPLWPRPLRLLGTFELVCLAWLFFRCPTIADAWTMGAQIAGGLFGGDWRFPLLAALLPAGLLAAYALAAALARRLREWAPQGGVQEAIWGVGAAAAALALALFAAPPAEFIYFVF